jgi:hypothetical protein
MTGATPHPIPAVSICAIKLDDGNGLENLIHNCLKPQVFRVGPLDFERYRIVQ